MAARPRAFCLAVNLQCHATRLPKLFVDGFAHALEQGRNIQKVIGRRRSHIGGNLAKIGIQLSCDPRSKTRQQQDPRSRKTKWQIMKNRILPGCRSSPALHELSQPARSAAQHVADIRGVQHHALRLAGRARGVNDGNDVLFRDNRRPIVDRLRALCENVVEEKTWRRLRPLLARSPRQATVLRRQSPMASNLSSWRPVPPAPAAHTAAPQSAPPP